MNQVTVKNKVYKNLAAACKENGKEYRTIYQRIHTLGWTVDKAFTKSKLSKSEEKVVNAFIERGCKKIADNRALKTIFKRLGMDEVNGVLAEDLFAKRPDSWFVRPDGLPLLVEVDDEGHSDPKYWYYELQNAKVTFAERHERDLRMDKLARLLGAKVVRIPVCQTKDRAIFNLVMNWAMTAPVTDHRLNYFYSTDPEDYYNQN